MTALAYRSGTQRLAINTARGAWTIYDISRYDPKLDDWRRPGPVVGTRTNRVAAVALARSISGDIPLHFSHGHNTHV